MSQRTAQAPQDSDQETTTLPIRDHAPACTVRTSRSRETWPRRCHRHATDHCGSGASDFGVSVRERGGYAVSVDPIYARESDALVAMVHTELDRGLARAVEIAQHYDFSWTGGLLRYVERRQRAGDRFLADFARDRADGTGRYVAAALPILPFADATFALMTIAAGVLLLHERLHLAQRVAITLACTSALVLVIGQRTVPWVALALAGSFAGYTILKKRVGLPAVDGFAVETSLLAVPALGVVAWLELTGHGTGRRWRKACGPASAGRWGLGSPLLCFGAAVTRLPLATLGAIQYLAPVLQFLVGVLIEHEAMPAPRLARIRTALGCDPRVGYRHYVRTQPRVPIRTGCGHAARERLSTASRASVAGCQDR